MLWEYVGERKKLFGKWRYEKDTIENPTKPPGDWVEIGVKPSKPLEEVVSGNKKESKGVAELKAELMKKKMKELREIGKEYNVYDTKKSELVAEIVQAQISRGEI